MEEETSNFYPERHMIFSALELGSKSARQKYVNEHLGRFYRRMGHSLPKVDGPRPNTRYKHAHKDPRVIRIDEIYRGLVH